LQRHWRQPSVRRRAGAPGGAGWPEDI